MSKFDLDRARLPRAGSTVAVRTPYQVLVGELVAVLPGDPQAARMKDRRPRLALRNDAMSATIPEVDICEVRTLKRKRAGREGDGAKVSTYSLTTREGRHIRRATRVTFPDATEVSFTEKLTRREALQQAAKIPTNQRARR